MKPAFVDPGLPRRATVRRADSHYDPKVQGLSGKIDILLDGQVLPEAASWDVDAGEITRQVRTVQGALVLDETGTPMFELLRGHVEVRWLKGAA